MKGSAALIILLALAGCAAGNSITPALDSSDISQLAATSLADDNRMLWGEWTFYFSEAHDQVDVVPKRAGRFHLNALKFLEEYCTDCLEITNIKNNGDSTIDLTVQLEHPFPGHPEFTGFDVKGIIMFEGSWTNPGYQYHPPWPEPFIVSWRKLGDPQLMNADGYTLRWSPSYDSGKTQPIFIYWEGKYSNGTPTANLNGYLDFYTDKERHMFRDDGIASRTYTIWLPPGEPVVAGYAVEAVWEPPLINPVTDPINEFPITANQVEAYEFYINLNNGEPITDPICCGKGDFAHDELFAVSKQWGGHTATAVGVFTDCYWEVGTLWPVCDEDFPDHYCGLFNSEVCSSGEYIGVAINFKGNVKPPPFSLEITYSLFEFTIEF